MDIYVVKENKLMGPTKGNVGYTSIVGKLWERVLRTEVLKYTRVNCPTPEVSWWWVNYIIVRRT